MRKKKLVIPIICVPILLYIGLVIGYNLKTPDKAPVASTAETTPPQPPTRAELLQLVNAERARAGVAPLTDEPRLDTSAQEKADEMVKDNNYGHFLNGVFVGQQYINATGITCRQDDENLNNNITTASLAVSSWMGSTVHREAILNSHYTLTGFGVSKESNGLYYTVEHFCEP